MSNAADLCEDLVAALSAAQDAGGVFSERLTIKRSPVIEFDLADDQGVAVGVVFSNGLGSVQTVANDLARDVVTIHVVTRARCQANDLQRYDVLLDVCEEVAGSVQGLLDMNDYDLQDGWTWDVDSDTLRREGVFQAVANYTFAIDRGV